ncbi:MAG TPA: BTAD domain-containing putative transcriptional regulator [Jiangellales bacterium]|nr:BTAD domain-containing putative transcriptional regulator [Jiangellales bacterium]
MSRSSASTPRAASDVGVTFGVLGPLEVLDTSGSPLQVPGRQERALLALLLTAPGRVFAVSAIVAGLWADEPPPVPTRPCSRTCPGCGGRSPVVTRWCSPAVPATYWQLIRPPGRCGAVPHVVVAGRRELFAGQAAMAADHLRDALALWRGEAYAEFDAPFAVAERIALEELRLTALEDRVAADLALGAGSELVGELEALVGRHPWRERLWVQLVTALYRSGRQAEALSSFQRARAALVEELGIEPGPELRAVEAQVLAQDPLLLAVDRAIEGLPPALAAEGPTFVGREAELARLVEAYERAVAGAVERILVTGRHGMGKTRLLAELAREVQALGGLVKDGSRGVWPGQGSVPVVLLLDDLQRLSHAELAGLAERVVASRPPLLVVGTCVWEDLTGEQTAALAGMFRDRLPVPPLQPSDVARVVALYVPSEAADDAVDAVATAGGVPLQVHAAASRYGEALAAAHVEEAAASISGPRRRLSMSQERIADGVLGLQRIRLLRAAHDPVDTPRVLCPYKGLAFFDIDDAPYFFGRERLVARLVARLVDTRLLAVVGASGSGKSSVVRAGLVAAIREGMLPGSLRWSVVVTTPTQPVPDLHVADEGRRTVLVVDQFEEVFTALSPSQRAGYVDWLDTVAADDATSVVVTVRSDYYPQAAAHRSISELLAANTVLVGEMTPDELLQAIELPAAAAGLELEPGLAAIVAADVAGQPGGLPLMSTALLSVWERREGRRLTLAAYHEIGGVRAAVARLAETAYQQLTPDQQTVARRTLCASPIPVRVGIRYVAGCRSRRSPRMVPPMPRWCWTRWRCGGCSLSPTPTWRSPTKPCCAGVAAAAGLARRRRGRTPAAPTPRPGGHRLGVP